MMYRPLESAITSKDTKRLDLSTKMAAPLDLLVEQLTNPVPTHPKVLTSPQVSLL